MGKKASKIKFTSFFLATELPEAVARVSRWRHERSEFFYIDANRNQGYRKNKTKNVL